MPDVRVIPNTAIAVFFERTLDDGQSWEPVGSATFPGGTLLHPRTGAVVTESFFAVSFFDEFGQPFAKDGDTRVRCDIVVPLTSALTLEMLE